MINKVFIFLSYHSYTIIKVLFALNLFMVSVIGFIFGKPITGLLSFIFFFFLGLFLGFWVYNKVIIFLKKEDAKENRYLQSLSRKKKHTLFISYRKNDRESH